jgi:hypothetical protein
VNHLQRTTSTLVSSCILSCRIPHKSSNSTTVEAQIPVQPDIGYWPDYQKYKDREHRRCREEELDTVLRSGLPSKIDSLAAWESSLGDKPELWLFHLSLEDICEIDKAVGDFQGQSAFHGKPRQVANGLLKFPGFP